MELDAASQARGAKCDLRSRRSRLTALGSAVRSDVPTTGALFDTRRARATWRWSFGFGSAQRGHAACRVLLPDDDCLFLLDAGELAQALVQAERASDGARRYSAVPVYASVWYVCTQAFVMSEVELRRGKRSLGRDTNHGRRRGARRLGGPRRRSGPGRQPLLLGFSNPLLPRCVRAPARKPLLRHSAIHATPRRSVP